MRPSGVAAGADNSGRQTPSSEEDEEETAELKVEDVLLFFDDVKKVFGDRPSVYNEFVMIMRDFKNNFPHTDTSDVIARVSRLFHGHNHLIDGFNKFIPPGYKIDTNHQQQQQQQQQQGSSPDSASGRGGRGGGGMAGRGGRGRGGRGLPTAASRSTYSYGRGVAGGRSVPSFSGQRSSNGPSGQLKQPPSYSQPNTGTAGRGRGTYTSSITSVNENPPSQSILARRKDPPTSYEPHIKPAPKFALPPIRLKPKQSPPMNQKDPSQHQPPLRRKADVGFDHALSYLSIVKQRFSFMDPSMYPKFLDVLKAYKTQKLDINRVLAEVIEIFEDHPDLLREFTIFLPDEVKIQAKGPLYRAAAQADKRLMKVHYGYDVDENENEYGNSRGQKRLHSEITTQSSSPSSAAAQSTPGLPVAKGTVTNRDPPTMASAAKPDPSGARTDLNKSNEKIATNDAVKKIPLRRPDQNSFNPAVERQFFDAVREELTSETRRGGDQDWDIFIQYLDAYSKDNLERTDLLELVEPLLGESLYQEFQQILAASRFQKPRAAVEVDDIWYSAPLAEIDFSKCRCCTPSYRALPPDYPKLTCSGRTKEDQQVLTDQWVSLPVGSEESYTFRHMRRNKHEEILFQCEDERFEIDMVIDSNATTLNFLEPIAKEIAQLSKSEAFTKEIYPNDSIVNAEGGLGGKRFQYTFDKNSLRVTHRNAIARIYGDDGDEMLDLMVKNPTVAIPIIVRRLRQKNNEWAVVRECLNRRWSELAKINYYRSLDHSSLVLKAVEKRTMNNRALVAEIKDRAAHGGQEGEEVLRSKLAKGKEEHGAFFEVTMGDALTRRLDLTHLPKPDKRIFTPHLSLMYENNSWAQYDAYRILCYAIERGNLSTERRKITSADKDQCHRLWFDFLGPWFNLSLSMIHKPALNVQLDNMPATDQSPAGSGNDSPKGDENSSNNDDESFMGEEEDDADDVSGVVTTEFYRQGVANSDDCPGSGFMGHLALPVGARVLTLYGEGRVASFSPMHQSYVIKLAFGSAHLQPSAIICTLREVEKSEHTAQFRAKDWRRLDRSADMLAIGTQNLYLFFRLHHILVQRLIVAKQVAYSIAHDITLKSMVEQMTGDDLGHCRYEAFLSLVYSLIDNGTSMASGSIAEGGKYEDRIRCLLGPGGYELATMDKLISHLLKNLQTMGNDDTMWSMIEMFRRHLDEGNFKPDAFIREAATLSGGEELYAFQYCPMQQDDKSVLHFEFLGDISEDVDEQEGRKDEEKEEVQSKKESPAVKTRASKRKRRR